MQGAKSNFKADLKLNDVCVSRCALDLKSAKMSETETTCLRQCYYKAFEGALLIENELVNYTRGVPL